MQGSSKYIYVVLSRTSTKIAKTIRFIKKAKYSHAAISLDENLSQIYGFAREQYYTPLLGKLVKESLTSYTLNRNDEVPVKVFRIPVNEEMYDHVCKKTFDIFNDPEFYYNLLSAATQPIGKGFETYKAYTCIEFVMMILREMKFPIDQPLNAYMPDDLLEMLEEYAFFEGDIRDIMDEDNIDIHFFEPVSLKTQLQLVTRVFVLCKRSISREILKYKE